MRGTGPMLEGWRRFHSLDAEESCAYLATQGFRLEFAARSARDVDTRINGVYFPGMYVGYLQYRAAAAIRAYPTRGDFRILPPLRGRLEAEIGNQRVASGPGKAIVTSPWRGTFVRSETASGWLNVFLRGPALVRQLGALLGDAPTAPLELGPLIDLGKGYGKTLARCINFAIADFEDSETPEWGPLALVNFEQFVLTHVLLFHPHNYTEALCKLDRPATSRAVKRAIDFMQSNLHAPIEIADLVSVSGVAGRTLYRQFHDARGISPMRYLRNVRLDCARTALLRAPPDTSVGDVAAALGFQHMGRFSAQYCRRFGELPSATISGKR